MDTSLLLFFGMMAIVIGGGLWIASRPTLKEKKPWEDFDGI